jgi:hypothetical protein
METATATMAAGGGEWRRKFAATQRAEEQAIGAIYEPRNLATWNVCFGNYLDRTLFFVPESMRKNLR